MIEKLISRYNRAKVSATDILFHVTVIKHKVVLNTKFDKGIDKVSTKPYIETSN